MFGHTKLNKLSRFIEQGMIYFTAKESGLISIDRYSLRHMIPRDEEMHYFIEEGIILLKHNIDKIPIKRHEHKII